MQKKIVKISGFLFLLFLTSCKVASVNSDRNKLINLEKEGWMFYLNSEKITLGKTILDRQNFESFDIKKLEKKIYIKQKLKKPSYTNIKDLVFLDSLGIEDFVVLNGVPFSNFEAKNLKIEKSAITKVTKIKDTAWIGCRPIKNLILISVK